MDLQQFLEHLVSGDDLPTSPPPPPLADQPTSPTTTTATPSDAACELDEEDLSLLAYWPDLLDPVWGPLAPSPPPPHDDQHAQMASGEQEVTTSQVIRLLVSIHRCIYRRGFHQL